MLARFTICLIAFALLASLSSAQLHKLNLLGATKDSFIQLTSIPTTYNALPDCLEALSRSINELRAKGYLAANMDSLTWNDSASFVKVSLGKVYKWASIRNGNIPKQLLSDYRFDEKRYMNQAVNPSRLVPFFEKLLKYYEENGYPFASVKLDSIQEVEDGIQAVLMAHTGPYTLLDTIIINDDIKISKNYLLQYLGIKEGMPYNESKIRKISSRISELPFLAEAYPWKIYFNSSRTRLNLYLKNKSANRADVLIGLLPNNEELGGRFLLTGDVKLAFSNVLERGEQFQFNWQNLQYKSPRLNIQLAVPYLFNSPLGVSAKFDFYKKDTTFRTVNGELGLLYPLSANESIKLYYEIASSRMLSVNQQSLQSLRSLPAHGDVSYRTIGSELRINKTDYRLNPTKGFEILLNGNLSFRTILKNPTIESTIDNVSGKPFSYLYDSIALKNYRYSLNLHLAYYKAMLKRLILATQYKGAIMYSTQDLFKNELFQIGGYRILRGFDEGSLFVNNYNILTVEPRYLLSKNSYFFVFSDISYIQSKYARTNVKDVPYSVGLGMSFETRSGLFNISYAVGGRNQQPIQLRSSKIHFGYINTF